MEPRRKHLATFGFAVVFLSTVYISALSNEALATPPTIPWDIKLTLLEPPTINKTVPVAICVRVMLDADWPNMSIKLGLFKRPDPPLPYDDPLAIWRRTAIWVKTIHLGDLAPHDVQKVTTSIKVEEPGLYTLAYLLSGQRGGIMSDHLSLNVSENTIPVTSKNNVLCEPVVSPPPETVSPSASPPTTVSPLAKVCGPTLVLVLAMISIAIRREI